MKNTRYIIIRNDDLCALSDPAIERRILEIFEKHRVPQVISVIPNVTEDLHDARVNRFHPLEENPAVVDLIREYLKKGLIEVAQHGYTHQTSPHHPSAEPRGEDEGYQGIDRKWTAYRPANPYGYSEFGGLSVDEQREKILKGRDLLEQWFNTEIKTFVFPWDRLTEEALNILKDNGFQYVLCSKHSSDIDGVNLIRYVLRDSELFKLPDFLSSIESLNTPVLVQVTYHSWMYFESEMQKLDELLRSLSGNARLKFITAYEIADNVPGFHRVLKLKYRLDLLAGKVNRYLGHKIDELPYYSLSAKYYYGQILKTRFLYLAARCLSYQKALFKKKAMG